MGQEANQFRRVGFDLKSGRMEGIAFGDTGRAPDLLFLHATGMNALTYRAMLAPLGERHTVLAVDMRGHGRTKLPASHWFYRTWNKHRDDVIELLTTHFQGPVTLAGHSMGGTVSVLVSGARPELTRGLCLLDPVIRPQLMDMPAVERNALGRSNIVRGALRRRARFADKTEAFEALKGRGFFKTFPDEALRDYIEDGFVESGKGDVTLACTPRFEAATFMAQGHDAWGPLARAGGPIVMLRAEHGSTTSDIATKRIAEMRADARIATVEGSTHALPIERADRARAAIEMTLMLSSGQAKFHDLPEEGA